MSTDGAPLPSRPSLGRRLALQAQQVWRWTGDWRAAGLILRSPLVRVVAIIPAIGYVILYNDGLIEFLKDQQTLGGDLLFNAQLRMHLLYVGAIFILIAWAIYATRCPELVKGFSQPTDYVDEVLRLRTPAAVMQAAADTLASRHAVALAPSLGALLLIAESGRVFWRGERPANEELRGKLQGALNRLHLTGQTNVSVADRDEVLKGLWHGAILLFEEPGQRHSVCQLLTAHLEALALRAPVSSRIAMGLVYSGVALFFAPAAETLVRVVGQLAL